MVKLVLPSNLSTKYFRNPIRFVPHFISVFSFFTFFLSLNNVTISSLSLSISLSIYLCFLYLTIFLSFSAWLWGQVTRALCLQDTLFHSKRWTWTHWFSFNRFTWLTNLFSFHRLLCRLVSLFICHSHCLFVSNSLSLCFLFFICNSVSSYIIALETVWPN